MRVGDDQWGMRTAAAAVRAALGALLVAGIAGLAPPAGAHTESDVVAVGAGSEATVTLKPTHGCGESPTVSVAIRAPVAGATAGDVPGWTATATPDGDARTVLEWTGGSLPADATGAFLVTFTVPDTVGDLLTFPSIQHCESGEELAWISGDPADEFPAPRLLVLPAGSAPAATIDDVAPDAPGRDQLAAIVDVDNPAAGGDPTTTTSTTARSTTTETTEATEATDSTEAASGGSATDDDDADDDDSGTGSFIFAAVLGVLVLGAVGIAVQSRRRAATRS